MRRCNSLLAGAVALALATGLAQAQQGSATPSSSANPPAAGSGSGSSPSSPAGTPGMGTPPATSRERNPTLGEDFGTLDRDRSGDLTNAEFGANNRLGQFKTLDANGDGRISEAEFDAFDNQQRMTGKSGERAAGQGQGTTQSFTMADQDRDGSISTSEFGANHPLSQFRTADANGDGRLSESEFMAYQSDGSSRKNQRNPR